MNTCYFMFAADNTAIQADTELLEDIETEPVEDSDEMEQEPETVFVYESELVGDDIPEDVQQVQAVVNTDDVVVLLKEWQKEQQQYEQKVLEVQTFISDQTKNITSLFFLLVLAVGLMSGIILAKAVWRKF